MPIVIYHWEVPEPLNNAHARKKLLNMVSFTCKAFGVLNLIVVTKQEIQLSDSEVAFSIVKTLEEALDLVDGEVVYLEEGGTNLEEFVHPIDAVYVLGSNYGELPKENAVTITANNALHAEVALGIVLNHRFNGDW